MTLQKLRRGMTFCRSLAGGVPTRAVSQPTPGKLVDSASLTHLKPTETRMHSYQTLKRVGYFEIIIFLHESLHSPTDPYPSLTTAPDFWQLAEPDAKPNRDATQKL